MNLLSLKKTINYKFIEYQKRKRSKVVFGFPYWLTVDPSSICNLRCRFCPTGQERNTRERVILPFDKFKKVIDRLGPYLLHIDFCNWGEPLLNKEIYRMITYAKKFNVTMKIDTNFNIPFMQQDAEMLVRSGLDKLTVSLDGATQKTYETYRKNGNIDTVLGNIRLLAGKKRELKSDTPHVHWQFLVFKHNEHEIETARKMAHDTGADSIGFTAPFCAPEWVSTIDEYNNYKKAGDSVAFKEKDSICEWLWDGITINANGAVSPCCSVEDSVDDFDNFFSKPFWLIWNGRKYRTARAHVNERTVKEESNVCTRCDHIGSSNHRKVEP